MAHIRLPVKSLLVEFWKDHQGQTCTLQDISRTTGLTMRQAQTGMNNLRSGNREWFDNHFQVIVRGNTWVYGSQSDADSPAEKPRTQPKRQTSSASSMTYKSVGTTSAGEIIVRDTAGRVYKLTEL